MKTQIEKFHKSYIDYMKTLSDEDLFSEFAEWIPFPIFRLDRIYRETDSILFVDRGLQIGRNTVDGTIKFILT